MSEPVYERVVGALKAHGSLSRGKNWQCPGHDDVNPSLSVNRGVHAETGEAIVLLHCHAGCSVAEILTPLGLEPSDLFGGNGHRQEQLFPPSQYSPVGVDVLCKLPAGAERTFIVASPLGRFVPLSGGRERVQSRRQILAVILEARHRKAVLSTLGISRGVLRNEIMKWRDWGVAHACSLTVLTILVRDGTTCPVCKASLVDDGLPSKASLADDGRPPSPSPLDDAFVPGVNTTDDGFFKGVSNDGGESRWEVYPELRALEMLKERRRR